jgi:hypothetical protein
MYLNSITFPQYIVLIAGLIFLYYVVYKLILKK